MKKLFLITFLLMALVFTAVACGRNPFTGETTSATTTVDAPDTLGVVTGGDTQTATPVETTAPDETTAPVETIPAEVKLISKSYEVLKVNGKNFFDVSAKADTQLAEVDHTVTTLEGEPCESVTLRGWIGYNQNVVKFGYAIDGGKVVYADEFKTTVEDVLLMICGQYAARFEITADTTGLAAGEHEVVFFALLEGGAEVAFYDELTLVITTPAAE